MGGKPKPGEIRAYECTLRNKVTGWDKTHVVFCEHIDMAEKVWHEVHEEECGDNFTDTDMPENWSFVATSMLDRCAGCGGLKRPGPEGTGAVYSL